MVHNTFFIREAKAEDKILTLEGFLLNIPGVERALINIKNGELKIGFNKEIIELKQIADAIVEYGFHIE